MSGRSRVSASAALIAAGMIAAAPAAGADTRHPEALKIYETYCVQCHGVKRDGGGINSPHMAVKPRDHTDAKAMGDLPDDQIFKAIKLGGLGVNKSILMPAWGGILSDTQITDMVAYLHEICRCGK